MSASKEWTEWHLTLEGWVQGTTKTDSGMKVVAAPEGVLATHQYFEEVPYTTSRVFSRSTLTWQAPSKTEEIHTAMARFGPCPKSL
jgi:hypothetical protein